MHYINDDAIKSGAKCGMYYFLKDTISEITIKLSKTQKRKMFMNTCFSKFMDVPNIALLHKSYIIYFAELSMVKE